jgi:ferredoxin
MRIHIDRSLCSGHGRCFTLSPEVFGYDDQGFSVLLVDEVTPDIEEAVGRGVDGCPEGAISLDES